MRTVTYLYDDPRHRDRPSGHVESPEWTDDDRALLLALDAYESTLCPGGCGQPRELAWHSHMEGFYDPTRWICHACTAREGLEVAFAVTEVDRDLPAERIAAFPPFEIGVTTTEPSDTTET